MTDISKKIRGEDEYVEIRRILLKRIKKAWQKAAKNEKKKKQLSDSNL